MRLALLTPLLFTWTVLVAAKPRGSHTGSLCDVSKIKVALPSGQTNLTVPSSPTSFIALGVGTQNYTCNAAGTYAAAGAVAEIFDISCLYGSPAFNKIEDIAIELWNATPSSITIQQLIESFPPNIRVVLGQHYFVANGNATAPKWDFTSSSLQGNPEAYVLGARVGNLAAPTGKQDVDWLQLNGTAGSLAETIHRTDTRLGQPPSSCTPGSAPITVKYVSKYWFAGAKL